MPPLSEHQQKIRERGIGSSEIAAVVGEHPYRSPSDVWLVKRGLVDEFEGNGATWLGNVLEAPIAERYSQETGRKVRKYGRTVRHAKHRIALASPDYSVVEEERLLEIKSVGMRVAHHWSPIEEDGVPGYTFLQTQWQMGVTGTPRCDVAVVFLLDGSFRIYELAFHQEIFERLVVIAERFWALVESGEAPTVDHTDASREVLESIYGRNRAPLKPAPPEATEWFYRRIHADAALKAAKTEKELASNKLCELIGDADGITGEFGSATWKADKNGQRSLRVYPRKEKVAA